MKLHGAVYIIVGLFIGGFSYYITSVSSSLDLEKFLLFIYVGVGFVGIGLVKLVLGQLRKPKVAKENFPHVVKTHNEVHRQPSGQHNAGHPSAHAAHPPTGHGNPHIKYCSQCGSALRKRDKFCYKCGNRSG